MLTRFLRLLTELSSRKFIAQLTGKFAKSAASKIFISKFAKVYQIRIEDAEKELSEFTSLNDFFTRRLKTGVRPLDLDPDALLSPVDAVITGMGAIHEGQIFRVKGQEYRLQELLHHSPRIVNYKHGSFFVLYLSPSDYHRIHAPVSGTIIEKDHIPGKVLPVNDFALRSIPQVLSRNTRLITYIQHDQGEIALVKVGAMNVSSIQYTDPQKQQLERGEEFAFFEFGSTVVLLIESKTFKANPELQVGNHVMMGQSLGNIHKKMI